MPIFALNFWASIQRFMRPHGWWCLALVALATLLLWRGLISSDLVISGMGYDGSHHIYHTYSYLQEGFAQGELRTWNPHMYCGNPVVGTFQYVEFYPLRWLCALLPMPASLNWLLFMHICLAGINMYVWAFYRSRSDVGAFVAGVVFMLCGSLFVRVPVGHFTLAYAIAWIPLVFRGVDGWCDTRQLRWLVLASGSAALQMYAGHPQYFYNTMLMAAVYSLLRLFESERKIKTAVGLLAIYPLAAMLAAVVLVPGYMISLDAARAGGVSTEWAAAGCLEFKDLLLIFVPGFFGPLGGFIIPVYWDTQLIHECWIYSGLGGLLLAGIGFCKLPVVQKGKFLFLLILTLVLALGIHTPLFDLLRSHVPMYSSFRVMGRWTIFFSLFVALLASFGVSQIASGEKSPRGLAWIFLGMGACFILAGVLLYGDSLSNWYYGLASMLTDNPLFRQFLSFADRQALAQGASAGALCFSGGLAVILSLILLLIKHRKWLTWLLVTITAGDLLIFAAPFVLYFDKSSVTYPELAEVAKKNSPDDRNYNMVNAAANITLKQEGITGFDPIMLRRYVELITASQGPVPKHVTPDLTITRNTPVFKLLRVRNAYVQTQQGIRLIPLQNDVLPRFLVAYNYKVFTDRDTLLRELTNETFNYSRDVLIETQPNFLPQESSNQYRINVISSSSSCWTVEVQTTAPGVLLMTDSYAKGWQARPLIGSVQGSYDLVPADWSMRGILLNTPGRHVIEIKYTPPGLALGIAITLATLIILVVLTVLAVRNRRYKISTLPLSSDSLLVIDGVDGMDAPITQTAYPSDSQKSSNLDML